MDKPTATTGAPSALSYIAEKEAKARVELESAEMILREALSDELDPPADKDGIDFTERVKVARSQRDMAFDRWEGWADKLHKFDKSVAPEKRSASENMTRDEVRNFVFLLAIHNRSAFQQFLTSYSDKVLSCRTSEDVCALISPQLDECTKNAYLTAKHEGQMPEWAVEAFEDSLGIISAQK
jgi:hypothetical protein